MGRGERKFSYYECATVDRALDKSDLTMLRRLPRRPTVTPTRFASTVPLSSSDPSMDEVLQRTFDACLCFENSGIRSVTFRVPTQALSLETVNPYLTWSDNWWEQDGLRAEVDGDDLILRFYRFGEDNELFNLGETGQGWLERILPVRAELMSGELSALQLGELITHGYGDRTKGEPDLPAEYGLSAATRILAAYMLIPSNVLENWANGAYSAAHRFSYYECATIDRAVDECDLTMLRRLPRYPAVTPTRFVWTGPFNYSGSKDEVLETLECTFDACLRFENYGTRSVAFRVPTQALSLEAVSPFLIQDDWDSGLTAEVDGDDLILRFYRFAEDAEEFNLRETGQGWLERFLSVRAELMSGDLSALQLGKLIADNTGGWAAGGPDLPAEYGLSAATRILAAYMLIPSNVLENWANGAYIADSGPHGNTTAQTTQRVDPIHGQQVLTHCTCGQELYPLAQLVRVRDDLCEGCRIKLGLPGPRTLS